MYCTYISEKKKKQKVLVHINTIISSYNVWMYTGLLSSYTCKTNNPSRVAMANKILVTFY